MANLSIKIKVDDSEVNGLASKIKSAINGINFDMDKGQIARMGSQLESAFSNISVDINTSSAMNKIESLQSAVSQLETNMKDLKIGFNMDDIKAGDIISELNKQTKQGMEVKAIEDYKKSLTQANDLRKKLKDDTISEHTRSQYNTELGQMEAANKRTEKLFNEQYKDRLSQRKEMTDFQRDLDREYESFNPTKDIRDNAKQSNDYIKQYQKNLKDISKHQQLLDKSAEGSASYKANQSMIDSLKKDQADIAQSLEKEMKIDISTDDATSKLQNILKLQEEVSRASQTDKEVADYAKDINKLESERVKLAKQAEDAKFKGNEGTSAELTNQSKAINNQIQDLKQAGTAWDNFTDSQKNAMNQTKQQSDNEINNAKKLREARQVDNQAMEKAKQQAADYKELEKATNDYYKTASKVSELQAKMDSGTNTPKDGERLVEQIAMMDAQKQQMESMRDGIKDVEQYSQAYDKMVKSKDQSLKLDTDRNVNTQKQVAEMREVQNAYKQIEDSIRKVDQLERQKDGAGDTTVKAIENQIQAEERLQQQIRETNNLRENGNDSLEQGTQELKEQLTTQRQADEQLTSAQRIDSRRDASKNKPHGITGRMMDWDNIVPTIDVMDVAREGYQAMRKVYDEVASVDKALVSVRKVVNTNDKEWGGFTDTLYDNATAVGKSATEYASSVGMWAQAGKTLPEAQELARLSTMGAFVGELSEGQMVDYMSVPLNAFSADMLEAQDILNVMNEVSNNNAVEMDHLGSAYTRAAQTAALSGTSFAELTALIGTAQEATRLGGETIGTSLRQMDVNLGRIATKSTKGLEDKFDFFKDIGVDITDANGEIRSTFDVLEDLQGVWGSLDSVTQRKAAFDLAGARGQAIMSGLMSNWGKVEKMMGEAGGQIGLAEGVGSAFDEFAIQTDSLEFKANKLKNTWNEFISETVGGSDTFKGFFDTAIDGVDMLSSAMENENLMNFGESIGKMLGVDLLTNVGLKGIRAFEGNAKNISQSLGEWNKQGTMFSGLAGGAGKMFGGLGKSASMLGTGFGIAGMATEVFFLADAIGQLYGKDLSGWVSKNMIKPLLSVGDPISKLRDSTTQYMESVGQMNETFAKSDAIKSQIEGYRNLATEFSRAQEARKTAFAQTGDFSELVIPEADFDSIREQHNQVIEDMGVPIGFRIEFNNYDHVMEQINNLKSELAEIEAKTMREDIQATDKAFTDRRGMLGEIEDSSEKYRTSTRLASQLSRDIDKLTDAGYGEKDNISAQAVQDLGLEATVAGTSVEDLRYSINSYEESAKKASETTDKLFDSAEFKETEEAVQKATARMNDYISDIMKGENATDLFMDLFGDGTTEAQQTGIFSFLMSTNKELEKVNGKIAEFNAEKDTLGDFSGMEAGSNEAAQAMSDILSYTDELADTPEMKSFFDTSGYSSVDQLLNDVINGVDGAQEKLNSLIQDTIPVALEEQAKTLADSKEELMTLATDAGFTPDQVAAMRESFKLDPDSSMGDMVRTMMDINKNAASLALDIDPQTYKKANDYITLFGENASDVFGNITDAVYELETTDPIRFAELVDTNDVPEFDKIISDLDKITNKDFLVSLGVTTEKGQLQDIGAYYDFLDSISSIDTSEIAKLEVTPELLIDDDTLNIPGILDAINAGELSVDVQVNPETDEVEGYILTDLSGTSVPIEITPEIDKTTLAEHIAGEKYTLEADVAINPTTGNESVTGYDDWARMIGGMIDTEALEVDVPVIFQTDIEPIDADAILQENFGKLDSGQIEHILEVVPNVQVSDDGAVSMNSLTDELQAMITDGLATGDTTQVQTAVDILVQLGFLEFTGGAGAISEEMQQEIDSEVPDEIEAGETVARTSVVADVNAAGVGPDIENQVQSEAQGISVEAPVDIQAQGNITSVDTDESGLSGIIGALATIASTTTATVVVDVGDAEEKIAAVDGLLTTISARTTQVVITGNALHALAQIALVAMIRIPPKTVMINGNAEGFHRVMGGLTGKSVTVDIKGRQSSSNVIGSGSVGALMSSSIGSAMNGMGLNRSSAIGTNRSTETKVNEDVWRYWAQEMYTGNPITNSLDELSSQLKRAGDDYAKIIKITEQQIKLTRQQISHEEEMRRLEQKQIGEILADLRKQGFTTDGNRITNLDRAKTFSGDTASEVDKLLGEWKGLYESINSLDSTISDLQTDIYNFEQDIRDAREDEEADKLEKTLNRSEALLRAIETNTSIQSQRVEALGAEDYEMSLSVNDSAILSSTQAMQQLIAEFNKMSATTFEFEDNAEDMHGHLEDLRDQILENADSILEYRDAIDEIRIRRVIDEFDRFAASLSQNADMMSTNIDRLREGLLSGAGLSELGAFSTVDFGQKTQFERDFEERLALEKRLDEALEAYSEANVERIRKASADELKIQQSKYSQLISMVRDYSIGEMGDYSIDYDPKKVKEVSTIHEGLLSSMDKYNTKYQALITKYNNALSLATSGSQQQSLYNQLILDQLQLQEEYQYETIAQNQLAIAQAQELAKNTSLTTEQKRELLDAVNDYQQNIVDAQQIIRDSISARYEFEFQLMDEATAKYKEYYDSLAYMLNIAELTNASPEALGSIFEAMYGSLISQYDQAKKQLAELTAAQAKLEEGSFEWKLLSDRIKETTQSVKDLGLEALNANKDILDNTLSGLTSFFERGFLDGATLEEWENYHKNWISGVEKELAIEELRIKSLSLEDDVVRRRLEALDRQDEVSRKELEYLDKQMKLSELEAKLANIEGERDVQTLVRRDDGTFAWEYMADQSDYESTQKEILEAQKALEEFRREQRGGYVSALGEIIDRAKSGSYDSPEDLQNDLNRLNAVYGSILSDIPGFQNMSLEDIVSAYQKYMNDNAILAGDMLGKPGVITPESEAISLISDSFVASFMSVSEELGKIIGAELRSALGITTDGAAIGQGGVSYHIAHVELPNVTDGVGLANFFNDLPAIAQQQVTTK